MFLQVTGVGMSSDEEQEGAGRRGGRMAFTDQVHILLSAFDTYVATMKGLYVGRRIDYTVSCQYSQYFASISTSK